MGEGSPHFIGQMLGFFAEFTLSQNYSPFAEFTLSEANGLRVTAKGSE